MIAKALEENGAQVYIVGRRKDVLESVAKKEAVSLDIRSESHDVKCHDPDSSSHRNMANSFLS